MYRLTSKLIIYSNIGEDSILYRLAGSPAAAAAASHFLFFMHAP